MGDEPRSEATTARIPRATEGSENTSLVERSENTSAAGKKPRARRRARETTSLVERSENPAPQARNLERAVGRARLPLSSSEARIPAPQARIPSEARTSVPAHVNHHPLPRCTTPSQDEHDSALFNRPRERNGV